MRLTVVNRRKYKYLRYKRRMSKKMQFGRGYSEIEKIIRLKAYQGKRKYDYIPL